MLFKILRLVIIGGLLIGLAIFVKSEVVSYWNNKITKEAKVLDTPLKVLNSSKAKISQVVAPTNPCSSNSLSQLILVSISQRHLWACNNQSVAYNSAVVTGMEFLAADLTPTGTYHIYAKERDTHLIGHDSTGSWNDYVYYWMPFLDNQYGVYGLHDATWRRANAFGNISPESSSASHGCVECPLGTAAWLYNWASVGTAVTVES